MKLPIIQQAKVSAACEALGYDATKVTMLLMQGNTVEVTVVDGPGKRITQVFTIERFGDLPPYRQLLSAAKD